LKVEGYNDDENMWEMIVDLNELPDQIEPNLKSFIKSETFVEICEGNSQIKRFVSLKMKPNSANKKTG